MIAQASQPNIASLSDDELIAEGFMPVAEAARFLAMSRSYLYEAMDAGQLPYQRLGRSRRIPRVAVKLLAKASLVRDRGT